MRYIYGRFKVINKGDLGNWDLVFLLNSRLRFFAWLWGNQLRGTQSAELSVAGWACQQWRLVKKSPHQVCSRVNRKGIV